MSPSAVEGYAGYGFAQYGCPLGAGLNVPPASRIFTVPATGGMRVVAVKTGAEVVNFALDWSKVIQAGDSILTASWSASLPGISVMQSCLLGTLAIIRLGGGTTGAVYNVTCTITTAEGFTYPATLRVRIVSQNFL
jgi:hypothetical protein